MSIALDRLVPAPTGPPPPVELDHLRLHEVPGTFGQEALPLIAAAFDDRPWDVQAVSQRVLDPQTLRRLITAREAGRLVGLTTLHSTPQTAVARLHWLAVAVSHRRTGIGTALVVAAGHAAAADGFVEMRLKTETYRVGAIRLYRRLGFTIMPT